jgi:flagellar M-ring protein FliF
VTLDYDSAEQEETQETYDPTQTVTLSMQRTEQTSGPQPVAAGVPGTASNAPNAQSQALPVYPQQNAPAQNAKSESGTYGASKTVRHKTENPGRVRRMTAAIVVNDRLVQTAQKGKPAQWQNRSVEELRNLTALAQAAVGFDGTRGDLITVQDLPFDGNRAEPAPSPVNRVLETAESSPQLMKYAALLTALLLVMAFGVRPALRRMVAAGRNVPAGASRERAAARTAALHTPEPPLADPQRTRAQQILEEVSGHLKREPAQSSRLLQSWIHSD